MTQASTHSKLVTRGVVLSVFLHSLITYLYSLKISAVFPITLEWNAVARFYMK